MRLLLLATLLLAPALILAQEHEDEVRQVLRERGIQNPDDPAELQKALLGAFHLERQLMTAVQSQEATIADMKDAEKAFSDQREDLEQELVARDATIEKLEQSVVALQQRTALLHDTLERLREELEAAKATTTPPTPEKRPQNP